MKKIVLGVALFFIFTGFSYADMDSFLADLNSQAAYDRDSYNARLSSQFGIPLAQTDSLVRSVHSPADAFMVLQLGRMTGRPYDTIFNTYKRDRKKGWGAMAQQLGIKPGSAEFHALKRGDFVLSGGPGGKGHGQGKAKGKGKWENDDVWESPGKGHGKGHNK